MCFEMKMSFNENSQSKCITNRNKLKCQMFNKCVHMNEKKKLLVLSFFPFKCHQPLQKFLLARQFQLLKLFDLTVKSKVILPLPSTG